MNTIHSSETPLYIACKHGHDPIVRILLDAGADASLVASTPATLACANGHFAVVQTLINHDSDLLERPNEFGWNPLLIASRIGQVDICRFLLDRGCNIEATDRYGNTALLVAAQYGRLESVRLLLGRGCNVHATNGDGTTALMLATYRDSLEVMRSFAPLNTPAQAVKAIKFILRCIIFE